MRMVKVAAGVALLGVLVFGYFARRLEWPQGSPYKRDPNPVPIVVIDPGHGGAPGGVSVSGVKEKEITLDIAVRLEELVRNKGTAKVFLTRRDDRPISLVERRNFANTRKCDIFVSIHSNASRNSKKNHTEVYFSSPWSEPLARSISTRLARNFSLEPRVENVAWTVIWDNWAPLGAVLVETMYLTHQDGERILSSEQGRQRVAESLFTGIEEILATHYQ
ncbi:MAG: N-acetylmuramoyl-L-alanine amidase [bacterium]|nr:N-acetylmuramoyl-L-alanine amidase [bacterium]